MFTFILILVTAGVTGGLSYMYLETNELEIVGIILTLADN